jgi:very-short-patch-repair endonuclease
MTEGREPYLPSRTREGSGVGTVSGIRRPTARAQQLRRDATPAERKLWSVLGASKLGTKFSRQMPVGPYICDFLSRSARLAIELDGDSHARQIGYDERRTQIIEAQGIRIIRFANADVMNNLVGVTQAIQAALAEYAHPQPLPRAGGE